MGLLKEGGRVYDDQISGVQDDGTAEGVIRAKIVNGDLFKYHASDFTFIGGPSLSYSNNAVADSKGRGYDSFVTDQILAGGTTAKTWTAHVWGKVVGLRFYDNATSISVASIADASIICDGVVYRLWDLMKVTNPPISSAPNPQESFFFIPKVLSEGWHKIDFIIHALPAVDHFYIFYGFILEKNPLHLPYSRESSNIGSKGVLTTSDVALVLILQNGAVYNARSLVYAYNLNRITYSNADTVARVVTITYNGVVIFKQSIAPGTTSYVDFPGKGIAFKDSTDLSTFVHKVDAGASSMISYVTHVTV